ncbi:hypothetical protein [Micromonospora narathiwatensis]|uniref:Uncharacterized protein n=1 Tax=Micromonospora narathiwatensis TaxID=299146 RepID=A0A1A9A4R0_9ACTN|nr:hypothetical protein [Micromonospora narathiwatensis]SBT51193.1 hypothetical protein GA0070621_3967 [Micromonospora narathiwatensis]
MRVLERLTAVVALALVLVGLGAPTRAETPGPGAVVTATPVRPAPPPGDPRVVVACLAHLDAPSDARTELSGVNRGDHRAGVVLTDGPDDLLPAVPVRVGGPPDQAVAPPRYRSPAVPLPPRGTLPTRAPPPAG